MKLALKILLFNLISTISVFAQAKLENFWPKLPAFESPLGLVKAPGLSGFFFVLEQRGNIYLVEENTNTSKRTLFLNWSDKVSKTSSETGLLGMAFHPDFQKNGRFFVSYTQGEGKNLVSHISELSVKDPANPKPVSTEPKILISQAQPYTNHNGGAILFGPDGYLYFSWGDGGAGGDPQNNSQNLSSLLGKILRIDVNKSDKGLAYSIPESNPFVTTPNARPEIYAYGLRNVWQMSFDPQTGKLWAGDVGQNAFEEIDIIESGENYGWRGLEAKSAFKPAEAKPTATVLPVWNYSQRDGDKSVTGGLVYHGKHPEWQNGYVYGDFVSGRIWIFNPETRKNELLLDKLEKQIHISCFAQSADNEIILASHEEGIIYKLVP